MPDPITKESLISQLREISDLGWIRSQRGSNNGAVGNTLEDLLGIEENNLPIPNAAEWELKAQRIPNPSLLTLCHKEPSPTALRIVPNTLLPKYGWAHRAAGERYDEGEMSFRATIYGNSRTDRGFGVEVDEVNEKIVVTFDSSKVLPRHAEWLNQVSLRVGLNDLDPQPYWGFQDLEHKMGSKLANTFLVNAQRKRIDGVEYFWYCEAWILAGFDFDLFLDALRRGVAAVDFDARTGHNHGTKFRIKSEELKSLYSTAELLFQHSQAPRL
jgi:MvaI/BcnI restriction endonuclease family